jgi:hypothetical protein
MAVLLSAVPFSWAALSTYLNTAHAKRTGGLVGHQQSLGMLVHSRPGCLSLLYVGPSSSTAIVLVGDMYWHLLTPLAVCTVGLVMLAFTLAHHPLLAFFALTLSATSQASNPLEWG